MNIDEPASVRYAPYNRKAQFILSRYKKFEEHRLGRKLSASNTRRLSKKASAKSQLRQNKKTRKTIRKKVSTAFAAPTRTSARIRGQPVQHVALQNTPRAPRAPRGQMANLSNMFSKSMGMSND